MVRVDVRGNGRPRRHALAGRQRRPARGGHLPPHRDAARSPPSRRRCSSAPRSTWAASRAATPSTRCPDPCRMDVNVRYLPGQVARGGARPDPLARPARRRVEVLLERPPADVPADHPMVLALLDGGGPPRALDRLGGARRGLRRGGLPRGGRARRRVRAPRRRPPRARGVRGDREPAALPARAGRVRPHASAGRPPPPRRGSRRREPTAARRAARTGRRATGASRAARRLWLSIVGGRSGGIIGLAVAISVGSYIYLDDTLEAAAPEHARGQGRARGHARRCCRASRSTCC